MALELSSQHEPAESSLPRRRSAVTAYTQNCQKQLIIRKRELQRNRYYFVEYIYMIYFDF